MEPDDIRVLVVHPPSDERREIVGGLIDLGVEVAMADDAGRALRDASEVDALVVRAGERKLALGRLAKLAGRIFVVGTDVDAQVVGASCDKPSEAISGTPEEMVAAVAKALGVKSPTVVQGPTLVPESGLWASPRSSVEAMLARRKEDDSRVAVLMTKCGWADDWRDAYVNNMKRATSLGHPCLGKVELAWTEDTDVHALWPLPPGRSLIAEIADHTLGVFEAGAIVRGLLDGMAAMHAASDPILFGPIGIGQVWLGETGPLFLFGGASRIAHNYDRALRGRMRLAIPMLTSAEELKGERATPASDTFYAAVLLYQLLTGSEPFPKDNVTVYTDAITGGAFREITVYAPSIDADLAGGLHRALSPEPTARPSLEELAEILAVASAPAPVEEEEAPQKKKRWRPFWRRKE